MKINTIALDLEGTLISNAISQIPRPHLYSFLNECKMITDRIVIFTTVREEAFRKIARLLVLEGEVPDWFEHIDYVHWHGKKKDLNFITNCDILSTVLIDDVEDYIKKEQKEQWIEIPQFEAPYPDSDSELNAIIRKLQSYENR